ncbi:haloalkane dehalogenase [Glycomyces arizonensis]|uniref:haloalkane dehalogenase n=1 Tax=Glycomyces arizonensis TaxID=256035 RepID=UPI0003F9F3B4|nr:haloalkane dehalogenase [Glycomyces arizonensis]
MHAIDILDSHMAYADEGTGGPTVVLLHGNPTSSHIWRGVVPHLSGSARVLAPDLIGMGASGKPEIGYRFADHAEYLDAWIEALGLGEVVLVGYDWGGSLALDWAARHPGRTRGVVLTETFLRPMTWAEYPAPAVPLFQRLRTPGEGEQMALEENWFIESALRATNPGIADADLDVYREPYPTPESRRPLLQWPREIPLDGEPADVAERFEAYGKWMEATPEVPKLLLTTGLGQSLVSEGIVAWAEEHVAGLEVTDIGPVGHHAPEDAPEAIGRAVAGLLERLA